MPPTAGGKFQVRLGSSLFPQCQPIRLRVVRPLHLSTLLPRWTPPMNRHFLENFLFWKLLFPENLPELVLTSAPSCLLCPLPRTPFSGIRGCFASGGGHWGLETFLVFRACIGGGQMRRRCSLASRGVEAEEAARLPSVHQTAPHSSELSGTKCLQCRG